MNCMQRSMAALQMERYDRVSVNPEIDASYAAKLAGVPVGDCFVDEDLHARVLGNVFHCHAVDGLYINLCLSKSLLEKVNQTKDGYIAKDAFGMTWSIPKNDVGTIIARDIKDLDDPRLRTDNPLQWGIVNTFRKLDERLKNDYLAAPGLTGPFSQVVFMVGLENTLMAMMDEPAKLKEVLEYRTALAAEWAAELWQSGAKCVWIGEGSASSSVISPQQYQEFVFPYQKRLIDELKTRHILSIMHICGDINKSLAYIAATGVHGIDIDYPVDLSYAATQVRGGACLKGNINPAELLTASPKRIFELSQQKIALFPEKGLILSTGCLVSRDTPPQNIDAMIEAACTN